MGRLAALIAVGMLAGCSYQLTLMPRDGGKLYQGTALGDGVSGRGDMSVTIEDKTYTGTWVARRAGDSFGLINTYGRSKGKTQTSSGFAQVFSTGSIGTALLRASDDSGLRCEFEYDGYGQGIGVCADDKGRVYDMQILRQ